MDCDRILHLIDPYVDGELSSSIAAEVAAHCVRCVECGRTLALAQVTASVLASGADEPTLDDDFTDRLLACVQTQRVGFASRPRRWLVYGAVSTAAAAVLTIAFLTPSQSERPKLVAGEINTWPLGTPTAVESDMGGPADDWQRLAEPFERGLARTQDIGLSLQRSFDEAMFQVLRAYESKVPRDQAEAGPNPAEPPSQATQGQATEDL